MGMKSTKTKILTSILIFVALIALLFTSFSLFNDKIAALASTSIKNKVFFKKLSIFLSP